MTDLTSHSVVSRRCRFCDAPLSRTFVDLGLSPLCQTHIEPSQLNHMEPFYPLHSYVCDRCFLVQLEEFVAPAAIFSDYAYFSSFSDSWVKHAEQYVAMMCQRFGFGATHQVAELASNDGYLLQHFLRRGIRPLGIEPAANVAAAAVAKGIPTEVCFFGSEAAADLTRRHGPVDLLLGNNVLAHVPQLNDFVAGMKKWLKPSGIVTMEFPHLLQLMTANQFDTIYHEHFSYFSFYTVEQVFARHGLTLFDVEELTTHGGSLRIFARHSEASAPATTARVAALRQRELDWGVNRITPYERFGGQVRETKYRLLEFLINVKRQGKSIVGYGAPGKGNTLLNYCGIRSDFLDYTVDRNPHKQGRYTPGTRIPILHPDRIKETRPDWVLILPWNIKEEIMEKAAFIRSWGGQFVVPIPQVTVY